MAQRGGQQRSLSWLVWMALIVIPFVTALIISMIMQQPAREDPAEPAADVAPTQRPAAPAPTAVAPVRRAQPPPADVVVYVVPDGECYHTSRSCRTLARSNTVTTMKLSQARGSGLRRCEVCH